MQRAALALSLFTAVAQQATAQVFPSSAGPVRVERISEGLEHPWAMAFLPDGRLLVTERPGRLRIVEGGRVSAPLAGAPEVWESGQGGLLDVALARDFAQTGTLFLSYSEPAEGGARTAVARARLEGDGLEDLAVIYRQTPTLQSGRHFGSRIVVAADGALFVTLGDRGRDAGAQDLRSGLGKVIRIRPDGSIPQGNPFVQGGEAPPEIWSWGHRNPQGAALDEDGTLWSVEHGARGGDEINRTLPGVNHGWPVISYGRHYSGAKIGEGTAKEGMAQPLFVWDPSIAPSGLTVYAGELFPDWRGDLFTGGLRAELLARVEMGPDGPTGREERLFEGEFGRIRDVRTGPDGALWFLTDEADGAIFRVAPAD
ncbi:MAG: PQQ-dependent sugar dehydrogenase [Rubrimonas sp.]|uniref:PQQ-dependent sugar dehydrogenase n=1 Tax=Rubrimonas sp. TaxID=2036015 RepID=UPI002FDE16E8